MFKVLAVILILGAGALALYFIGGDTTGLPSDGINTGDTSYDDVKGALKDDGQRKVRASCNAISSGSTCVDYVGSMWTDYDSAKLNCENVGIFSLNSCPYSDYGGCQSAGGTVMEVVLWSYREGPGGYDDETLPYVRQACNAAPNSAWVVPESFLNYNN